MEIEMQKRKFIFFVDDNFIANKEKAKELLRELIPLKIHWVSQGSVDMLYDDELKGAKKVLSAAAMTYVAAAISTLLSLLRLIILFGGRRRND